IMTKIPFRADHVGSLLRPERIHKARKDFNENNITAEELYNIETEEIKRIVDKQIEVGLEAVTDGEFRRRFWHTDFLELRSEERRVGKECKSVWMQYM